MYRLYFRLNEIVHATNSINSRPKTIQHSRVLVVCAILLKINLHSLHIYFPVVAIIKCFLIDSFALITWLQIVGKFKIAGEHYDRRMEIKDAPDTYCVCHWFRMRFSRLFALVFVCMILEISFNAMELSLRVWSVLDHIKICSK